MIISLDTFDLGSLLSYITDCHGLDEYSLQERGVDTTDKADVIEVISEYGHATECVAYLAVGAL
jgi:hypothetical protein